MPESLHEKTNIEKKNSMSFFENLILKVDYLDVECLKFDPRAE